MNRFNHKFWLGIGFVSIVFLLLFAHVASAQTVVPREDPIVLNGYMSCVPANDATRCSPFRLHYVNFTEGRTYLIRMESSDFGARLALEDMPGKMLAADDDWWDTLDGSIVFRPTATGSYRLVANAMTPMEGFYTITIRELPVVMRVEASLTVNDAVRHECYERTYDITLTEGRRYIIDMASTEFDAFAKLLNREGAVVSFANECDRMRNTRIVFTPTETGVYRIVATSYEEFATGAFRLTVCEE